MRPFNLAYALLGGGVVTTGLLGLTLFLFPVAITDPADIDLAHYYPSNASEPDPVMDAPARSEANPANGPAELALASSATGQVPTQAAPVDVRASASDHRALRARPSLPEADIAPTVPQRVLLRSKTVERKVAVATPPEPARQPRILRVADVTTPEIASVFPEQSDADPHQATFGTPVAERKVLRITR
ncbi:hypothetical protein [Tropicimonas sediminicola]|uniref:Uncharacterized protein n=1 Tax=Tropicimonas sediminicola TaxID=1031541 RepID=A0A239KVS3_9RHOB|nr:hypothetical protein [Tropicimonas sediminicola]SNT22135.1 hypothetical protein SAMN05421757_10847 [Tropicimonas sediminicola]